MAALMPQRNRILIITRNMPPLVGGMERLNWHMARELQTRGDVCIVAPEGSAQTAPDNVQVREVPLKPLSRFLVASALISLREALRWRPQTIIAGSGLTAPVAWLAARASHASCCTYVHGLDLTIRNPVYKLLWLSAIRHMDKIITNSNFTRELAVAAGVDETRIAIVHPGVAPPPDRPDTDAEKRFLSEHRIQKGAILLSVGRLSQRKGLREFVAEVLPQIVAERPDTCLVIAGGVPSHALHSQAQTPESIAATASRAGVGEHIRFLGPISDEDKCTAYEVADVHVFPVRDIYRDPEGFGMVAIEAASHGLPTVAYATGGVVDAVAEGISGRLIRPGDAAGFAAATLEMMRSPPSRRQLEAYARDFSWPEFGNSMARVIDIEPAKMTAEKSG